MGHVDGKGDHRVRVQFEPARHQGHSVPLVIIACSTSNPVADGSSDSTCRISGSANANALLGSSTLQLARVR